MTVVRSASGVRIDCDQCGQHAGAAVRSVEALRHATGYVRHRGGDLCAHCSAGLTTAGAREPSRPPPDRGPRAA